MSAVQPEYESPFASWPGGRNSFRVTLSKIALSTASPDSTPTSWPATGWAVPYADAGERLGGVELSLDVGRTFVPIVEGAQYPACGGHRILWRRQPGATGGTLNWLIFDHHASAKSFGDAVSRRANGSQPADVGTYLIDANRFRNVAGTLELPAVAGEVIVCLELIVFLDQGVTGAANVFIDIRDGVLGSLLLRRQVPAASPDGTERGYRYAGHPRHGPIRTTAGNALEVAIAATGTALVDFDAVVHGVRLGAL